MQLVIEAFRRAHRSSKVLTYEEAAGSIAGLPSHIVESHLGPWEDQLVAHALIVLRKRGAPEPERGPQPAFERLVASVLSCQEMPAHDDPDPAAGRKPAA